MRFTTYLDTDPATEELMMILPPKVEELGWKLDDRVKITVINGHMLIENRSFAKRNPDDQED